MAEAPSASSRQRNYAARISDQEWEKWKDEIRTEFLSDKPVEKVVDTLNHRGLNVTKPQLEHKAKQWRLRRKLRAKTWRYVDHAVRKRKAAGKDSVVVLSGKRLSSKKVTEETARHQRPSLLRQTTPEPPGSEIDLFVCTPRATSPSPSAFMSFPRSLPWYQFLRTVSMKFLPALYDPSIRKKNGTTTQTFEYGEDTIKRLAQYGQDHFADIVTPAAVHFVLHQLVGRTIQILTRSEELVKLQIASLSVDWMAAQFSSVLPESFDGQNLLRASSLIENKHHDQQRDLLHILIYLASNHLILDEHKSPICNFRTAEALVLLFRLTDLRSPRMIHNLLQFSRESLTLAAAVEELFQAAIIIGALDIVVNILDENPWMVTLRIRIRTMWPYCVLPPLHYAVFHGSLDLANLLLKFQADVNEVTGQDPYTKGWTPLAFAACRSQHQMSVKMANLLLQANAMPNPGKGYAPLSLCLSRGNVPLAFELIELGATDSRCDGVQSPLNGEGVCATLEQRAPLLTSFSIFGLAVCVSDSRSGTCHANATDEVVDNPDELVVLRLLEALQVATKSHCGPDAMILAASRGHVKVMSYLRTQLGQAIDSTDKALSPLYAAVLWGQVDAARQLLEWGASASMDERLRESWKRTHHGLPTPLHIAIQFGSYDMVRLLIHKGAEVNQPSKFFAEVYSEDWDPSFWRPSENGIWNSYNITKTSTCIAVCPLFFAILQSRWDEVETLLAMGAEPSGDVLFQAAKQGQLELIVRLLGKGIGPDDSSQWRLPALEAAVVQGHGQVVSHLLRAGAAVFDIGFAALFCLPDVLTIRTLFQTHSAWPKLRDKRTKRSYLENAILRGHKEVVDLALQIDQDYYDSGALCAATSQDIMFHSTNTQLLLHELINRRERSSCSESQIQLPLESTAISMAAFHDRLDIVELLLRSTVYGLCRAPGVRVKTWAFSLVQNKRICDRWHSSREPDASPLEYAAVGQSKRASLRLLQEGYCPDVWSIFAAMSYLEEDVVELFIEKCENIDAVDRSGTLLQEAVRTRNMKLIERLLAKGADLNLYKPPKNDLFADWGFPAITIAAKVGDIDLVSLLLEKGADVNKGHSSGAECTALQVAVANGYISIVKCLITHHADMQARRFPVPGLVLGHGTPLEEAARWGRLDIVHLLLDSGLSTSGYHRVQYILSTIYAQRSGHHTVVQALYNHRPWSPEDQDIYQELIEFPPTGTLFFHPKEHPEAEFLRVVTETLRQSNLHGARFPWWKNVPLVPGTGIVEAISVTEPGGFTYEWETNEEESIADSQAESESLQERIIERMDENVSAGPGIEGATFRNDSILTILNGNGGLGSHESSSKFPQAGASKNVNYSCISWPHDSGPERPEGNGTTIPMESDNQTLQYSLERDNPSTFRPVGEITDAFDIPLWPSNDIFDDIFEWPADNDVNVSTDLGSWNFDPTFTGWEQDTDSRMEFGDMFDLNELFQ